MPHPVAGVIFSEMDRAAGRVVWPLLSVLVVVVVVL